MLEVEPVAAEFYRERGEGAGGVSHRIGRRNLRPNVNVDPHERQARPPAPLAIDRPRVP